MAKQLASQKYVLKIHTKRLQKANWNLNLELDEAKNNKEVISLADSQTLTFIDTINNLVDEVSGVNKREENIRKKKKEIKINSRKIKEEKNIKEKNRLISKNKKLLKELDNLKFIEDYVCLIIDKSEHFDKCNQVNKSFYINGKMFRRLLGTPGGIKNRTIVYVSENVYPKLKKKIDNGRNLEKKLLPAKLEAYRALTCSSSIPVSIPKGVVVVNDCITKFKEDVIEIDDSDENATEPTVKLIKDYEVELNDSDGFGLITPNLAEEWKKDLHIDYISSGFCIRNAFCKGMLFTFDFHSFAKEVAKSDIIIDAWGQEHKVKDIDMILTTSMLKLWDSYNSIDHYLRCCNENGYTFRVAKVCPKELENERTLNYQFIQSFELDDHDIEELIKPTIDEINGSLGLDYAKTLLYLRGQNMNENNAFIGNDDYTKALMIEPELIKDSFIQQKIVNMRRKRINEAKVGTLNIRGNYAVISGDPYSLCQSMFGLKVTGLLKANQCYSKKWNDIFKEENKKDRFIVAFRAPMSCHNNIRKLEVIENDEMLKWYKYMTTVNILSSWDTVTHAENGADKDGDTFITTDNKVLLNNLRDTNAIFCIQKSAEKVVVTEKELSKSNKAGFGDAIGTTTNRITEMYDVQAGFEKGSPEYNELEKRIMCGQHYQQCAIDKIKGIESKPMPLEWYDSKPNLINISEDGEVLDDEETIIKKEFNMRIVADKKPYFFIYIYPRLKASYNSFIKETSDRCKSAFGCSVEYLLKKDNKTKKEEDFIRYYNIKNPVSTQKSTMNRICIRIEKEFEDVKDKVKSNGYDYSILKNNKEYSTRQFNKIKKIYKEYNDELSKFKMSSDKNKISKDEKHSTLLMMVEDFKVNCMNIIGDEEVLCNILIDLCYSANKSKQFAWDMCGSQIIKNLLNRCNGEFNYLTKDNEGTIDWMGNKFKMVKGEVK